MKINISNLTWDQFIYPRGNKSQQTINTWISDIRARQKTNRNNIILKLSRFGWTQEKISEKVGIN